MTIEEVNNQLRQRGATSKSVATKAPAQPATTSKLNIETLRRRIAEARQQFTVAINGEQARPANPQKAHLVAGASAWRVGGRT